MTWVTCWGFNNIIRSIGTSKFNLQKPHNIMGLVLMGMFPWMAISRATNLGDSFSPTKESTGESEILCRHIIHFHAIKCSGPLFYWNDFHIQNLRNQLSWKLRDEKRHQFKRTRQNNHCNRLKIPAVDSNVCDIICFPWWRILGRCRLFAHYDLSRQCFHAPPRRGARLPRKMKFSKFQESQCWRKKPIHFCEVNYSTQILPHTHPPVNKTRLQ